MSLNKKFQKGISRHGEFKQGGLWVSMGKKNKKEFESYRFYWGSIMGNVAISLEVTVQTYTPLPWDEEALSFLKLSFLFVASLDGPRHKRVENGERGRDKNHERIIGMYCDRPIQHAKYSPGFFFLHRSIFDFGGFINGIISEGMVMPIFLLNRQHNKIYVKEHKIPFLPHSNILISWN